MESNAFLSISVTAMIYYVLSYEYRYRYNIYGYDSPKSMQRLATNRFE